MEKQNRLFEHLNQSKTSAPHLYVHSGVDVYTTEHQPLYHDPFL